MRPKGENEVNPKTFHDRCLFILCPSPKVPVSGACPIWTNHGEPGLDPKRFADRLDGMAVCFRFHSRDFRLLAFHLYQDRRDAAAGPLGGIAQTTRKKFGLQYVRNRRESPVTPPGGNPPGKYTLYLMPAEEPRIYAAWRRGFSTACKKNPYQKRTKMNHKHDNRFLLKPVDLCERGDGSGPKKIRTRCVRRKNRQ